MTSRTVVFRFGGQNKLAVSHADRFASPLFFPVLLRQPPLCQAERRPASSRLALRQPASLHPNRGPISIFGPTFKVEDRSEDPDLRIVGRSWWPLVEGGSEEEESGGFFVLLVEKVEDGGVIRSSGREDGRWGWFFVLRTRNIEEPPHLRRNPPPFSKKSHPPPSSVRSSTHSSRPKIEDGGVFDLRGRTSKIEGWGGVLRFSAPGIEDRGFFDFRSGRVEDGGVLRRLGVFFEEPPHLRRTPPSSKKPPPSSFFDPKDRRTTPIFDFRSRRLGRRSPSAPGCSIRPGPASPEE